MDTMIGPATDGLIDRFEDLTADLGSAVDRPVRPAGLTSRDIEAEAQVRLARRGYDWSGTLGTRRRAS
jgi:hypothetical protein